MTDTQIKHMHWYLVHKYTGIEELRDRMLFFMAADMYRSCYPILAYVDAFANKYESQITPSVLRGE